MSEINEEFFKIEKCEFPDIVDKALHIFNEYSETINKFIFDAKAKSPQKKKIDKNDLDLAYIKRILFCIKNDKMTMLSPLQEFELVERIYSFFTDNCGPIIEKEQLEAQYVSHKTSAKYVIPKNIFIMCQQRYLTIIKYDNVQVKNSQMLFDIIFGKRGRDPNHHVKVLAHIIIMAIVFQTNQILYHTSFWIQKSLANSEVLNIILQKLIEEFIVYQNGFPDRLISIIHLCPMFCYHFIGQLVFYAFVTFKQYYTEQKPAHLLRILEVLNQWLEIYPELIMPQFLIPKPLSNSEKDRQLYKSVAKRVSLPNQNPLLITIWWMCQIKFGFNLTDMRLRESVSRFHLNICKSLSNVALHTDPAFVHRLLEPFNIISENKKDPYDLLGNLDVLAKADELKANPTNTDHELIIDKFMLIILLALKMNCLPTKYKVSQSDLTTNSFEQNDKKLQESVPINDDGNMERPMQIDEDITEEGEEKSPINTTQMEIENDSSVVDKNNDNNLNKDSPSDKLIIDVDWNSYFIQRYRMLHLPTNNQFFKMYETLVKG